MSNSEVAAALRDEAQAMRDRHAQTSGFKDPFYIDNDWYRTYDSHIAAAFLKLADRLTDG